MTYKWNNNASCLSTFVAPHYATRVVVRELKAAWKAQRIYLAKVDAEDRRRQVEQDAVDEADWCEAEMYQLSQDAYDAEVKRQDDAMDAWTVLYYEARSLVTIYGERSAFAVNLRSKPPVPFTGNLPF